MDECVFVCMDECVFVCMDECVFVCMDEWMCVCLNVREFLKYVHDVYEWRQRYNLIVHRYM